MFLVIVESIKTIRVPFGSFLFIRFLRINCLSIGKTICPSGTICPSFEPFVHRVTILSKVDLQSGRLNHCSSGDHLSIRWTICPSSVSGETICPSSNHLSIRWPFVHQDSSLGVVGGFFSISFLADLPVPLVPSVCLPRSPWAPRPSIDGCGWGWARLRRFLPLSPPGWDLVSFWVLKVFWRLAFLRFVSCLLDPFLW